jgi:bacteriocin-like protein
MRKLENMHTGMSDEPSALTEKELETVTGGVGGINPFLVGDIKGESDDRDPTVVSRNLVGVLKS